MRPTERLESLTHPEIAVLRIVAGEDVPGWGWRTSMSRHLEHLLDAGLVAGSTKYEPTPEGHAVLAAWRERQSATT